MPKNDKKIPAPAIPRLSLYYRALFESGKVGFTSSEELASLTGVTAAQVRRDLTYFGSFGTPGKGYRINDLKDRIIKILGTDKDWNVALVGAGNLGSAFLHFDGFRRQGFNVTCAFDSDPHKIGKTHGEIEIQDISEIQKSIKKKSVKIAIVTVPVEAAQEVIGTLVEAGVKAILNFTSFRPQVPHDVQVLNIDLSIELERLAYFLSKGTESESVFL